MSASRALQSSACPASQDDGSQLLRLQHQHQQQQQQGGSSRYESSPVHQGYPSSQQHDEQFTLIGGGKPGSEYGRLRNIRQATPSSSSSSSKLVSQSVSSLPVHSLPLARPNTPLSRPSSSSGLSTSACGNQSALMAQVSANAQQRTPSACSNITIASSGRLSELSCDTTTGNSTPANIGQCRICRKFIGTNESCHLCSNCNQFICEDCASYSATEQVSSLTYSSTFTFTFWEVPLSPPPPPLFN